MKTLLLVIAAMFSNGCGDSHSAAADSEATVKALSFNGSGSVEAVDFQGVSFRYELDTFGKVQTEVVSEWPLQESDQKPDGVAPEHILFTFELGREHNKAELAVYPLREFPKMYSKNPDSVEGLKEEIAGLQKVLEDASYRLNGEIPHLPFADASQDFHSKVRHFNFENGKGILFVMHWTHGFDFISNQNLIYRFEGITNDGKYYVTGEMPISVDFLPDDHVDEIGGFNWKDLIDHSEAGTKRYEAYLNGITSRIAKLNPNEFCPDLEKFESLISSLTVNK